jgi:hypothetical protein
MPEKTLTEILSEMMAAMKTMAENQTKLQAEQACLAVAMGESGIILLDNTKKLNNQGVALIRLWHEAGLPIADAPEVPPEAVN